MRFANICSDFAFFAERVKLARKKELLERAFQKFVCQYSDSVLGFTPNIQHLLQSCLDFQNCVPPGDIDQNTPKILSILQHKHCVICHQENKLVCII